jgi:hypothetical protein
MQARSEGSVTASGPRRDVDEPSRLRHHDPMPHARGDHDRLAGLHGHDLLGTDALDRSTILEDDLDVAGHQVEKLVAVRVHLTTMRSGAGHQWRADRESIDPNRTAAGRFDDAGRPVREQGSDRGIQLERLHMATVDLGGPERRPGQRGSGQHPVMRTGGDRTVVAGYHAPMSESTPNRRRFVAIVLIGIVAVFVVVLGVALALGVDAVLAVLAAIVVAIVVGGGVGLLVAGGLGAAGGDSDQ